VEGDKADHVEMMAALVVPICGITSSIFNVDRNVYHIDRVTSASSGTRNIVFRVAIIWESYILLRKHYKSTYLRGNFVYIRSDLNDQYL
jgi:hypothetical protein